MPDEQSQSPFERIIKASNRIHLDNPFRTSDELRTKHFPGAGTKLSHKRLTQAYLAEFAESNPDWQLLAHSIWPWLIGHAHHLASLTPDLETVVKDGARPLNTKQRKGFVEQFTEAGTEEIEVFLGIFANGDADFQKAVLEKLKEEQDQPPPVPATSYPEPTTVSQPQEQIEQRPTVEDLDPITRAKMSLIGTLFFFALSLIPLGIQFWRQPDQDHWVVSSFTGVLALLTLIFLVGYLRKKP